MRRRRGAESGGPLANLVGALGFLAVLCLLGSWRFLTVRGCRGGEKKGLMYLEFVLFFKKKGDEGKRKRSIDIEQDV